MQVIEILLVVLSFIALFVGVLSLSQATSGVGGVAVACFLAILARIAQAAYHNGELKKMIEGYSKQFQSQPQPQIQTPSQDQLQHPTPDKTL